MNYRIAEVMAVTDLGADGTKIIDLNLQDPISALVFVYRITNVSGAKLEHDLEAFSKIELVDGSDVLMSLVGTQLDALDFFETGKPRATIASNFVDATTSGRIMVHFGRYLGDPELALDPKKFRNPQIRITHDLDTIQATATPLTLQVLAYTFDEKVISPIGFLQSREFNKFTTASTSTYYYVDLPTDLPIRKLLIQPRYPNKVTTATIDELRISEDNDKKVPIDISIANLVALNKLQFGEVEEGFLAHPSGESYPTFVAPGDSFVGWVTNASGYAAANNFQFVMQRASCMMLLGIEVGDYLFGTVKGTSPHQCVCLPFGDQKDIADWYDATRLGSLRMRLHTGSVAPATGVCRTILQQLRRY